MSHQAYGSLHRIMLIAAFIRTCNNFPVLVMIEAFKRSNHSQLKSAGKGYNIELAQGEKFHTLVRGFRVTNRDPGATDDALPRYSQFEHWRESCGKSVIAS
jgi:hypothetical protein